MKTERAFCVKNKSSHSGFVSGAPDTSLQFTKSVRRNEDEHEKNL